MVKVSSNKEILKTYKAFNKPFTIKEFLQYLERHGACFDAVDYVRKCKTFEEAWNNCERYDWMDWVMSTMNETGQDEYLGYISDLFFAAYPHYEGWGNMRSNWGETASHDERKKMKTMAKELRLFVSWAYMALRLRMYAT